MPSDGTNKNKIIKALKKKDKTYFSELAQETGINTNSVQTVIVWMYWRGEIEKITEDTKAFQPTYFRLSKSGKEKYK